MIFLYNVLQLVQFRALSLSLFFANLRERGDDETSEKKKRESEKT